MLADFFSAEMLKIAADFFPANVFSAEIFKLYFPDFPLFYAPFCLFWSRLNLRMSLLDTCDKDFFLSGIIEFVLMPLHCFTLDHIHYFLSSPPGL